MLFPQIRTHGVLQEGASRGIELLRSTNRLHDGSRIQGAWIRPLIRSWRLSYVGLTDEESGSLRQLIVESAERRRDSRLLILWSNMLGYSEDLGAAVWQASAFSEVARVMVTRQKRSTRFGAYLREGGEGIEQVISLGGTGVFCFSCEVRSDAGATGRMVLQGANQIAETDFTTGPAWRQVWVVGEFAQPIEDLHARIEVGPGETLLVRGIELDYQATPTLYKPSYGSGGVYSGARVVEEGYVQTLRGQGWFDCQLEVRVDSRDKGE